MKIQDSNPQAHKGKEWEREVRAALLAMDPLIMEHGFDNVGQVFTKREEGQEAPPPRYVPKRPADRVVCWRGHFLLLEAKECRGNTLPRSYFTPTEEESLWKTTRGNGLAIVVVRHLVEETPDGPVWEAWACHYATLIQAMRDENRKSLRIDTPPPFAVVLERGKVGRKTTWVLADCLARLRAMGVPKPYKEPPSVECPPPAKTKKGEVESDG
jgi:hypothetical protein